MAPPLRPAALALLCARLGTFSLIVEAWTAKDLEPPTGPDPVLPGAVAVARAGGWALRLRCLPHGHGPPCAPPRRAPRHAPLDCSPLPLCPPGCSETPTPCPEPGGCQWGRGCEDCRIGPCRRPGGCECPGGAPCPCPPAPTPDPPCASHPCAHGGTCQELEGSFACRCPPGFAGRTCERGAPACAARPCFNGGSCAPRPGGAYTCRCPPGFAGSNCERRLDRCAPRPCMHGGHCLDLGRSLLCKCRPGFTGPRCEENMDDCAGSPCANGGTCLDGVGSYSCSCTLGYGGRDCSQRVGACGSSPCLNGGACYTHFSGHVCRCPASYMGARCEFEVPRPPQDPGPAALALSGALMLAALAVAGGLVGATAWCWCHRGVRGAASPCQGLGTIGNLLAPFKGSPQDPGVRDLLGSRQELLEGPGDVKKLEKTPVPGESRSLAGFPAPGAIRPPHLPQPPVFTTEV